MWSKSRIYTHPSPSPSVKRTACTQAFPVGFLAIPFLIEFLTTHPPDLIAYLMLLRRRLHLRSQSGNKTIFSRPIKCYYVILQNSCICILVCLYICFFFFLFPYSVYLNTCGSFNVHQISFRTLRNPVKR